MSLRYLAGYITESYNPLKVPNAPTLGTVTPDSSQVTVAFTAPSNVGGGAITSYIAIVQDTSTGVGITATGSASPITVTGLTNGQTYNVRVCAVNTFGPGPYSAPSANFSYAPKLYSWGRNTVGQLGLNDAIDYRSSPIQVGALTNWLNIACGQYHTIATKEDGTLWSWGDNQYGQLGQNNVTDYSSPVQVGGLTTWSKISGGGRQTIVTRTDGTLWAWGRNDYGQLGQNGTVNRSSPVQVGALTTWLNIACGQYHTIATKTDGTLWSWGRNQYGQLGLNIASTISRSSPVQIGALTNWSNVACGRWHTISTRTDGTLWAWGINNGGQLGDNTTENRSSPIQVGALTNWLNVACGEYHTIATKTDGTLWSWGNNQYGQLGLNNTVARQSPVQVGGLTTWLKVACGYSHTITIKTDKTLWTWGRNTWGQLGQNISYAQNRLSPVQVGALTTWINAAGGFGHTVATQS